MKHEKALCLARRYHFVLMDKICFDGRKPSDLEIKKTFNSYEDIIKELYFDRVEKSIIECLEKLPTHENWVHLTEEEINRLSKELVLSNE